MSKVKAFGYALSFIGICLVLPLAAELGDFVILFLLTLTETIFLALTFLALVEEEEE